MLRLPSNIASRLIGTSFFSTHRPDQGGGEIETHRDAERLHLELTALETSLREIEAVGRGCIGHAIAAQHANPVVEIDQVPVCCCKWLFCDRAMCVCE